MKPYSLDGPSSQLSVPEVAYLGMSETVDNQQMHIKTNPIPAIYQLDLSHCVHNPLEAIQDACCAIHTLKCCAESGQQDTIITGM